MSILSFKYIRTDKKLKKESNRYLPIRYAYHHFLNLICNHSYYNPALKKSDSFLPHPPEFQANCQVPVIKTMYQRSGTVQSVPCDLPAADYFPQPIQTALPLPCLPAPDCHTG